MRKLHVVVEESSRFIFFPLTILQASKSGKSANSGNSRSARSGMSGASSSGAPAAGSVDFYVSPFLFASAAFCAMRMISISVSLTVEQLLVNMHVSFFFESAGNALFLLSFTLVALCWCNLIIRGKNSAARKKECRFP